jgi:hypothetical protein
MATVLPHHELFSLSIRTIRLQRGIGRISSIDIYGIKQRGKRIKVFFLALFDLWSLHDLQVRVTIAAYQVKIWTYLQSKKQNVNHYTEVK